MTQHNADRPVNSDAFEVLQQVMRHMVALQEAIDLLASRSVAHQAAIHALIDTHPDPKNLFDSFSMCIDSIEGAALDIENPTLRAQLQQLQEQILRTINKGR